MGSDFEGIGGAKDVKGSARTFTGFCGVSCGFEGSIISNVNPMEGLGTRLGFGVRILEQCKRAS